MAGFRWLGTWILYRHSSYAFISSPYIPTEGRATLSGERCVCVLGEGGVPFQIPHPRHLLLHRRTEQGQPAPASWERNLLTNSGKGDAHHRRVLQEAALDNRSRRLWCLSALANSLPPTSLQKNETPPQPPQHTHTHTKRPGLQGACQAHCTLQEPSAGSQRLHKWSLMQSGGGNCSQLKTLSFVNYCPNLLGL